jgi:hypothetical protein
MKKVDACESIPFVELHMCVYDQKPLSLVYANIMYCQIEAKRRYAASSGCVDQGIRMYLTATLNTAILSRIESETH